MRFPPRTRLALWLSYVILIVANLYYPKWSFQGSESTLSYDVSGYYFYLPAAFIYQDLRAVAFRDSIVRKYRPTFHPYQAFDYAEGLRVMKYSAGQAVMYSPFFALGHTYAAIDPTYPADGFSQPYQVAIGLGSLLVAFLGVWLLAHLLTFYFGDTTVALTLLTIVWGTNHLNYAAIDSAMTHNYLFACYAGLLLLTRRFYGEARGIGTALSIGLLIGLMALTRPTEIIAALLPLLWGMPPTRAGLNERLSHLRTRLPQLAVAAVACLAVGSIQLIYWKYASGDWVVYSYEDQGFDWLRPHLINGLFSWRTGWLTYTPLMYLALFGLVALWHYRRELFVATTAHTILFIYIAFAWSVWWYGGSLGQRTMVQTYPVLAFPLAAGLGWALRQGRVWRIALGGLLLLGVAHNLWLTHQAHRGNLLENDRMNGHYYRAILFRFDDYPERRFLLDNPENRTLEGPFDTLLIQDYERDGLATQRPLPPAPQGETFYLDSNNTYSPVDTVRTKLDAGNWVVVSADFRAIPQYGIDQMAQLVLQFYRDGERIKDRYLRLNRKLNLSPEARIELTARAPRGGADELRVFVWRNHQSNVVGVDNLVVATVR